MKAVIGGLPSQTIEQIQSVKQIYPEIRWFKLFGSRALGLEKQGSDIDIAFSSAIDYSTQLATAFDELATPYKIDITHWESIEHGGLKAHIEAVGILL